MEIDFYVHGWADELPPVRGSSSSIVGFSKEVVPMVCGTPEARSSMNRQKPFKVTPLAKLNSNVINVGEASGTADESLPKKIAQLERALTYVALRANNSNIEEVVGYAGLCMSVIDGASIGSIIIKLHPNIFPNLARLQIKGGVAYLFSRRSVHSDVETLIDEVKDIKPCLRMLQQELEEVNEIKQQELEEVKDIKPCLKLMQKELQVIRWSMVAGLIGIGALAIYLCKRK